MYLIYKYIYIYMYVYMCIYVSYMCVCIYIKCSYIEHTKKLSQIVEWSRTPSMPVFMHFYNVILPSVLYGKLSISP